MELKSEDILLRRFRETDVARLAKLANNKNVSRNLRDAFPYPYTKKDAEKFIQTFINQKPITVFAIDYQDEYVGNIGLMQGQDVYSKSAEIGYFIGEPYWNKGIATIAVNLICDYGFKRLDVVRIHTGIFECNTASQHVLEKCGFKKEGVFKNAICKNNKIWNEIRYAKVV